MNRLTPTMREVKLNDGSTLLISYNTPVAMYIPGAGYFRTDCRWSVTTTKHIGRWGARGGKMVPQYLFDLAYRDGVNVLQARMLEAVR